ncbi:cellulose biosynthesis protein BcsP [Paraburkholderia ferrariae]|uniref:cellulose biosynthesis protein BcsP n=1 Tax=Paraburkholderia ferrariae TaxID=386056 RepID=UPI0004889199|nr:cellulose biosynthesis protein BcsP [Paraburkholderia ferrariae]
MSTSRDIKALFDRFGGDSSSYREIRMEGEAHEARGRWPLLGLIDPRKVELDALDVARGQACADPAGVEAAQGEAGEPDAGEAGEGAGTGAAFAARHAGGGLSPRDRSQAALRRSAPLFTRSPRRDIPPVLEKSLPRAPESAAFRFSPTPSMDDRAEAPPPPSDADEAASGAGFEATVPEPRIEPGIEPGVEPGVEPGIEPRIAPRGALPPLTGRTAMAAPAIAARTAPAGSAPLAAGPAARAAPNRPPAAPTRSSPLRKLVGAAPASSLENAPPARALEADGRLDSLFDRLRGTAQAPRPQAGGTEPKAAPAPRRPWFLKGGGRP